MEKDIEEILKNKLSIQIDIVRCPIVGVRHKDIEVALLFDNEVIAKDKTTLETTVIWLTTRNTSRKYGGLACWYSIKS